MAYKQKEWSPFMYEGRVRSKRVYKEPKFKYKQIGKPLTEDPHDPRPSHIKRKDYKPQSQSKVNYSGFGPQTTQWWKSDAKPQSKSGTGKNWWSKSKEYKPQSQRKK